MVLTNGVGDTGGGPGMWIPAGLAHPSLPPQSLCHGVPSVQLIRVLLASLMGPTPPQASFLDRLVTETE